MIGITILCAVVVCVVVFELLCWALPFEDPDIHVLFWIIGAVLCWVGYQLPSPSESSWFYSVGLRIAMGTLAGLTVAFPLSSLMMFKEWRKHRVEMEQIEAGRLRWKHL